MRIGTDFLTKNRGALVPRIVTADGDSITRGVGGFTTSTTTYPADASHFTTWKPGQIVNLGADGQTFAGMLSSIAINQYPYIDSAKNNGWPAICSCAGGTNDIGLTGTPNPATLLATATTYFADLKTRGASYTIGWTLLMRQGGLAGTAATQSAVFTYNNILRNAFAAKTIQIDYLVDAGLDATLGNPANVTNTAIFGDGLHPTIYGTGIMGNLFAAAVLSYQTRSVLNSISVNSGSHAGGGSLVMRGIGLSGATGVVIGGILVQPPNFTINSDQQITATIPAATNAWPYAGDVSVLGPNGCAQLRQVWTWT